MVFACLVSTTGDSNLAVATVRSLSEQGHKTILLALTNTAEKIISKDPIEHCTCYYLKDMTAPIGEVNHAEHYVEQIKQFIYLHDVKAVFIGIPSSDNILPYEIAKCLETPVVLAYEYMYKSDDLKLWDHLEEMKHNPKLKIGIPLPSAQNDFEPISHEKLIITGHTFIDNVDTYVPKITSENRKAIRQQLQLDETQPYVFISGSSQYHSHEHTFLTAILSELPNHPDVQVRYGIHPGITDSALPVFLKNLLAIYDANPCANFKFILTSAVRVRLQQSGFDMINHPAFVHADVNGNDAEQVSNGTAQLVPGELTNRSAYKGKAAYIHMGVPYLPNKAFSSDLSTFFKLNAHAPLHRSELSIPNESAANSYAKLMIKMTLP